MGKGWGLKAWKPRVLLEDPVVEAAPAPYRDPALQAGFRVKSGDELSGYTRETVSQESARLAGEYNRAGSNNYDAYTSSFSPLASVQRLSNDYGISGAAAGIIQGGIEGLVGTVGGVTDTGTRLIDNTFGTDIGSPVNAALMANERRMQEMGEGNASWFFRNVAKSITKVVAASPGGMAGVAANLFLEPAHQSYMRGREAGMSPKVALGYGVLHGATEAVANALVERVLPGTSSMVTGLLSNAVAEDVAKVAIPGIVNTLMKTAQASASEGAEEGAAFMIGAAIDESYRVATGVAAGKQYTDPREFAWDFAKSVGMGLAAGGLLAGGMQSIRWDATSKAVQQLGQQQPAQTPPNPAVPEPVNAPQQPTPLADPTLPVQPTGPSGANPVDSGQVDPQIAPVQQPVEQQPPTDTDEPWSMTREEFFRRIDNQVPVNRSMNGEDIIRGIDFIRANGSEETKRSLLRGSDFETDYLVSIGNALATGKSVPQSVLAQFPEFSQPQPNQLAEPGNMVEPEPVAQQPQPQPQAPVEAPPVEQPATPQQPATPSRPFRDSDRFQRIRAEEVPDPGEGDIVDLVAEIEKAKAKKRIKRGMVAGDMFWLVRIADAVRPAKYNTPELIDEWKRVYRRSLFAAARAGKVDILFSPGSDGDMVVGNRQATFFKLADKQDAPVADESMDLTPPEYLETRRLIANLPPERLSQIAAMDQASDAAFAKALGSVRRKLPVELNTKEKREFAVATARKMLERAATEKFVNSVQGTLRELSTNASTGGLISMRDIRDKYPEMSKQQFDKMMLLASRAGKVSLHRHDHASNLSPQERDQLVTDGDGNFYVGAAIRGASGKIGTRAAQQPDEAMDQSEEAADLGPRKPAVTNNLVPNPSDPVTRIIDAMTPAVRDKVAKISNPTMREFAKAMGLANVNQLPPELGDATNRGKVLALIKKMGQKPQTRPPAPSADRQVTFANSKDNQGVRGTPTEQNLAGPAQGVQTTPERITELVKTAAESVLRGSKLEVPLNEMRADGKSRGAFNRRVGSARVESRMNGPTIFHELGHAIETGDKLVLTPKVGSKAESQLRTLGREQTKTGGYAAKDIMPEGRAEFIRLYVQEGPAFLKQEYPELFDHFIKTMEERQPRALLNLTAAAAEYNMFIRQMNAVDRAGSRIADRKGLMDYLKKYTGHEYWRGLWERANGAFIDIAEVSNRMDKAAREYSKKVGIELGIPDRLRPDKMLVYLHGLASSHTQMWLDSQPVMWDGTRQGKSLRELLAPLLGKKEWIDAFNRLLLAKRTFALQDPDTLERMNDARVLEFMNNAGLVQVDPNQQGPDLDMRSPNVTIKRIDPRATGLSLNDARAAMYMLEAEFNGTNGKPNFKEILDDYYEFHDLLLQYAADASPTLKLSVDRIRAVNEDGIPLGDPGAYVPLLRDFEDERTASPTASAASGQLGRRLIGSDRQIKDPLMATVMNLEARLTAIHERVMLETVLAMADTPKIHGLAPFILKLADGESGKDGLATFEAVDRSGEMARYQINDQGVVRLLHAMDPVAFAGRMMGGKIIDRFVVGPNRILKNFTTGFNPRFAFLTQTIFSIPEMLAIGGSFADPNKANEATNLLQASIRRGKNHAELMGQMMVNMLAIAAKKSTLDRFIPGQYFQNIIAQLEQARADGVTFETSIRNDESVAWNISRNVAGRTPHQIMNEDGGMALFKWGLTEVPRWIGSAFGTVPEAAALAVYQSKLRELGLKPGDAKTIEQRMAVAEAVKESTGNYARRGSTMRYLEKLRPYSSAGVVHGMSLLRAIKNDPLNVTQVMGYATILGLLAVAKAMEDDEYLEADITQKIKYLHVKHDGKWYLLPQYSEFGLMTHGAAVVVLHALKGQNEDAFRGLMEGVKSLGLSVLGYSAATGVPVMDEALSQLMNEDVRQGDNIAFRAAGIEIPALGIRNRAGAPIVPNYRDMREGDVQPTVVSKREASEQYTDETTPIARGIGSATGISPMRIEHAADAMTGGQFSNFLKVFTEADPLRVIAPKTRKEGELSYRDKSTEFLYDKIKEANERSNDPRRKETEEDRDKRLMLEAADRARDAWSALQRATKDPDKVKEYAAKKRDVSRVAVEQYEKGDVSKAAFAVQERVASLLLAKEWGQAEEARKLIANGVDDLTRFRPMKRDEVERWTEDTQGARDFVKESGLSRDEILTAYREHMAESKISEPLKAAKLNRLRAALK